jgi:hydroxymethylpyrimidine pyrophosphatase-like HAD family hydrolase
LLRPDWTVSDRTRAALRSAAAAGVEVMYATGRPPRWLPAVYQTTEFEPVTVCANGALTLQAGEPVHIDAIPDDVVGQVREVLLGLHRNFEFRTEVWRGHTLKLLATIPEFTQDQADQVLTDVRSVAGHLVEPTHSAFGQLLIEMGPSGVTKARAVRRLVEQRWSDRVVIGIGDMPNDEALLSAVDIPMTVASGHPWLREITDRVLPGPTDDGVAQLLERLAAGGAA